MKYHLLLLLLVGCHPKENKTCVDLPHKQSTGTKLGTLSLQADLPVNATIKSQGSDNVVIEIYENQFIVSSFKVMLITSDEYPKTINDVDRMHIGKPTKYKLTKIHIAEKSFIPDDGWAVTIDTGETLDFITNYGVISRREIGGKSFGCETIQGASYHQQATILSICKSLRPAE